MLSTRRFAGLLADIDAGRARMSENAKAIAERELRAIRSLSVPCTSCKRRSALHRWTYIQHRSYTPPSGCTGGDYWSDDDATFCHLTCPDCGERSYIYIRRDRDTLVAAIKRVFDRARIFDAKIVVEADPQRI